MHSVKIQNLHKIYRSGASVLHSLAGISLTIEPGEFVCIAGGSGCGKTTLLRIIAGLDRAYDGGVLVRGQSITGPGLDRALVFQEHRLFPWLRVKENIAFGLAKHTAAQRASLTGKYMDLVGLRGFEDSYPHELSGGMAQRAALARALAPSPQILLLDEPFAALDAMTRIRLQQEMLRIWEAEQTTMILVTHDIEEAVYLANRVVVMSPRPGAIQRIVPVPLPHPRDRGCHEFVQIRKLIYDQFFSQPDLPGQSQ